MKRNRLIILLAIVLLVSAIPVFAEGEPIFSTKDAGSAKKTLLYFLSEKDKSTEMPSVVTMNESIRPTGNTPLPFDVSTSTSTTSSYSSLKTGSTFNLGHYEQDNNLNNGPEPIEWQVLTVQGDRALVISKFVLDYRAFIDFAFPAVWETSSMRGWLNEGFYNDSFTSSEQNNILQVRNTNPDNPEYGTDGGNDTNDKIFVLSIDEAKQYFRTDNDRLCKATAYAAPKKFFRESDRNDPMTDWLLRSPGYNTNTSSLAAKNGSIDYRGLPNYANGTTTWFGVRPAFWMKLSDAPAPTPALRSCYTVTYAGNDCLAKVPTDSKCYRLGDLVTLLFEPVEYLQGTIFNGWDMDDDGEADFGYYYNTFAMPGYDVELKAVCSRQYYDYSHSQYGLSDQYYDPQQYYNPYNDPTLNNDIYDPNTEWWFDPGSYYEYYYDGDG